MEEEELIGPGSNEHYERRCADCSVLLERVPDSVDVCEVCGEQFCRECAEQHIRRQEPMVCAACSERDEVTPDE